MNGNGYDHEYAEMLCAEWIEELYNRHGIPVNLIYRKNTRATNLKGRVDDDGLRYFIITIGGQRAISTYNNGEFDWKCVEPVIRRALGVHISQISGYSSLLLTLLHEYAHALQHESWCDHTSSWRGGDGRKAHGYKFRSIYQDLIETEFAYFVEEYGLDE